MNRAALVPESDRPRGFLDNWLDVHLETLSVDQLRAEMAVSAITTAELVAGWTPCDERDGERRRRRPLESMSAKRRPEVVLDVVAV